MATNRTSNTESAINYRIKLYIPVFVDGAEIDDFDHDYYRLKGLTFNGDANTYTDIYEAENKAADVLDDYVRDCKKHHEAISYNASAVIYWKTIFGGVAIKEIFVPSIYSDGNHSGIFVDPLEEHTTSRDYYRYCGDIARQIEAGTEINYTNDLLDFLVPEFTDDPDKTGEPYDLDELRDLLDDPEALYDAEVNNPGFIRFLEHLCKKLKEDPHYLDCPKVDPQDAKTWPHLNTDDDELPF